jgi:hypothetical protein
MMAWLDYGGSPDLRMGTDGRRVRWVVLSRDGKRWLALRPGSSGCDIGSSRSRDDAQTMAALDVGSRPQTLPGVP